MNAIAQQIASELNAKPQQVLGAMTLLDEGATVPFIARYRKEATGGLDDTQLRHLSDRLTYLRDLEARRQVIQEKIEEQGKWNQSLAQQLAAATTKQALEDLYLPYKTKRRTKAQIAKEAGLEPLANKLWRHAHLHPEKEARAFRNEKAGFADVDSVLEGARSILAETWAEDAKLLRRLRDRLERRGYWIAKVTKQGKEQGDHFRDYFDHQEPFHRVPSHRALAMFRGASEGMLRLDVQLPESAREDRPPAEALITQHLGLRFQGRPGDTWLEKSVQHAWKSKIHPHLKTQLSATLKERAETEAIEVFARNLKDLLLAAPAGQRTTLGLDPGYRTGVKAVVVGGTGNILEKTVIFPHAPQNKWHQALDTLTRLCQKYDVALISVGNGTASRETERLVAELESCLPEASFHSVVVSEAGASVYSASELAAKELPDMDVSYRGAVSIARRLQDPLAELVKIDPKAIGVGQYQHDLSPKRLTQRLGEVVEDCVNSVGVLVNSASASLLSHVAGLNTGLANNIVAYREANGPFRKRHQLLKVPRLGPKAFEQAAGFLRIRGGSQPLDASAVHPESYGIVEAMARQLKVPIAQMVEAGPVLKAIQPKDFVNDQVGLPTIRDILKELDKPGRDPRPAFKTAQFAKGIETMADLNPGLILEGVVRNVTNFGAFVDIGVHQDGLVHISALADHFVKDPREFVRAGQIVQVKVISVDIPRKRIALSMRLDDEHAAQRRH